MFDFNLIGFRKMCEADFKYMYKWLNTEFVSQWYGKKSWTCEEISEKYIHYITFKKPVHSYIMLYNEESIGYIQTYKISDFPDYEKLVDIHENAAGLDLFIGEEEYIHKGLGKYIISKFLKEIAFAINDTESCIIGPEPGNAAAIKTYEKVGFKCIKTIQGEEEGELEYIMRIEKDGII